ncbi:Enoyl-[acyl-carrier-protein] reductase [Vulgatibacter incomptus]|uniref:enoyl-[acyl-carrier-protein] reductase (NADH) n=1 Tax=Vulgatibacter incomptus TaxID=1391653 RepID=A0A0K1PGX0_9BACT|nr:Enoyl-[acyl-carrier-protein] reductase [Vulgatibacter incomptus]
MATFQVREIWRSRSQCLTGVGERVVNGRFHARRLFSRHPSEYGVGPRHDLGDLLLEDGIPQTRPINDWMVVCRAPLTSTVRYLAWDLSPKGIRINSVAAGPLDTMAAKSIPGFELLEKRWVTQAPLGRNLRTRHPDVYPAAIALLSDWFPSTSGEMVHVDGSYHAIGASPIELREGGSDAES